MQLNNMTFQIQGRLDHIERQEDGQALHIVTMPAVDAYSKPSSLAFVSKFQLGNPGAEIKAQLTLSTFVRHFDFVDKKTGFSKKGHENKCHFVGEPIPVVATPPLASVASQKT